MLRWMRATIHIFGNTPFLSQACLGNASPHFWVLSGFHLFVPGLPPVFLQFSYTTLLPTAILLSRWWWTGAFNVFTIMHTFHISSPCLLLLLQPEPWAASLDLALLPDHISKEPFLQARQKYKALEASHSHPV